MSQSVIEAANGYAMATKQPGIYFGLPEAEYHADPSLSATGIRHCLTSPLKYWTYSALNPNKPPDDDTAAKARGRAYHKLILEGQAAFDGVYCVAPDRNDYADVLDTVSELRDYAERRHGKKLKGTAKADVIASLREIDPHIPIWGEIMDQWERFTRQGREIITPELWEQLRMARLVIDRMPSVKDAFRNGVSEVSLFWVREDGVPMKCRLDYLNTSIVDLKSFANIMDKDIEQAVYYEITRNRYQIQPAVYRDGLRAMKALYRQHGPKIVKLGTVSESWLAEVMTQEQTRFFYAFIMTGYVPEFLVREWQQREGAKGTPNSYYDLGVEAYAEGVQRWRWGMETFGPNVPWVTDRGLSALKDERFPIYFLDQPSSA